MENCIINPKGTVTTNSNSILQNKLLKTFPDSVNSKKGSVLYDQLFDKEFVDFFGQWFVDENIPGSKEKAEKLFNSNYGVSGMFNEQGEPDLKKDNNEYYFVNSDLKRFVLNKNYLTQKDKIETINSLSLLYIDENKQDVESFVKDKLKERVDFLNNRIAELEFDIKLNKEISFDELLSKSNEIKSLKESAYGIDFGLLKNNLVLNNVIKSIESKLGDVNIKYVEDADEKTDNDPNTNDEINSFTKESSETRDSNNIDKEIKRVISSIIDYETDIDGKEIVKYSKMMQMPMAISANIVKNRLVDILSNIIEVELSGSDYVSDPYDLMIDKLRSFSVENNDQITRDFLEKIQLIHNSKTGLDKDAFKTKFVTSFYMSQNSFTFTELSSAKDKMIIRHINPNDSQDKEAFISNEMIRTIINKFNFNSDSNKINNESDYIKASKLLRKAKTKKEIADGLNLLGITVDNKTINKLFSKKENVLLNITNLKENYSLNDLFKDFFEQEIAYYDSEEVLTKSTGLKSILEAYSKSDRITQKNIISALREKDYFTPISILSKYEAVNKTDLSDSSLYVGSKQRWNYSLVTGLNKQILTWQAGNIKSLLNKKHKNLQFVNYLLAQDLVDKGIVENSNEHKKEISKRISNLKLIINSEIKTVNDSSPTQHKEIGEADLHWDKFFKMFDYKSEIWEKLDAQTHLNKKKKNLEDTKAIFSIDISADKSTSYSLKGFLSMTNNVEVDSKGELISLGTENIKILNDYLKGEFEVIKANSNLVEEYLNKKTKKQKNDYLMEYLIPDYHYVGSVNLPNDEKFVFIPEEGVTIKEDKNGNELSRINGLESILINSGSWNKFGFFNSTYENNKNEFDLLFRNIDGVRIADDSMRSHISELVPLLEKELIDIAKENKEYFDSMSIEDGVSLLAKKSNITDSTSSVMHYNYVINSIFSGIELFNIFNGELAFYKQKGNKLSMEDALKRGPAILADGKYIRQKNKPKKDTYISFNGKKKSFDSNKEVIISVFNDMKFNKSKHNDLINKGLGSTNLTYEYELADAQGLALPSFHKKAVSGIYGWSKYDDKNHNELLNRNHKLTEENIKWLKNSGRSNQSGKFQGYNLQEYSDEQGNLIGEFADYLKFSVAYLYPAIIKGTDLENLANAMQEQNISIAVSKSGSKGSNRQAVTIHNEVDGVFDGLKKDIVLNPFKFNLSGLKWQVELPTKFDKAGVLGNQHLKNLLANLDFTSTDKAYDFRGTKYTAEELFNEYNSSIVDILQDQLNEAISEFGINDENGIKTFDQTKLRELIINQLDANEDFDLIEILEDNSIPLEAVPGIAQRMFPIIAKYIHKNYGKIITNAGSAIQVANIGFDRVSVKDANDVIYLSEDKELRPPLPITVKSLTEEMLNKLSEKDRLKLDSIVYFDEENNPSLNEKKGKMQISNARIMLPFSSIFEQTGMNYNEFKKALDEGKIDKELFKRIIGYRIPNQSISSNDSIEIVGILPTHMGDTAIVYHEITAKTGSDFDIDKMYLMMPNFKYDKKENTVEYIKDESAKGKQNKLIELMQSILTSIKSYDDLISPLDTEIRSEKGSNSFAPKEAINEVLYLKSIQKEEEYELLYNNFKSLQGKAKSKFLKTFAERRKLNPLRQMSPKNTVKSRVDMLQAKKLVATMANHMTDIPMSQIINQIIKYDLGIGSFEFGLQYVKGQENNSEYKLTKIVSYLMNAAVDAAKDNYIIEGNFNSYSANGAMLMIRMGIDPVNVFKILLNDSVLELSKLKQIQTQKVSNINNSKYSQENLNNYSKELILHLQKNKIDFNDFIRNNDDFKDNLILGMWNIIQLAGKELNNDILTAKSDSNGAGKNIYEHHVIYNRLSRLARENIGSNINNNFVRGLKLFKKGLDLSDLEFNTNLDKSKYNFLGSMMNNSLFLTNFITKNMFVENTDNYRNIVNRISNQLGEPFPISEDNIKTISNYIYPYIMSQSGHGMYNIDESDVKYLQEEFPKEVISKKSSNPDNKFLKELFIDVNSGLISFPNYRYFDANDKILLRESLNDIYKQVDKNGNNTGASFINKLVKYAFLTTGFKPTFFAMNEYLPKSYFLDTGHANSVNKLIERMNSTSEFVEDESINKIMTFISINNENNYKIVANINKTKKTDYLTSSSYYVNPMINDSPIKDEFALQKLKIKDTNNFYPSVKVKGEDNIYLLTDIVREVNKENEIKRYPVYSLANTNSSEIKNDTNNSIKNKKLKNKLKLFDLNTLKQENLFIGNDKNKKLFIQKNIEYVSELDRLFGNNNWTIENDNISLQNINQFESNSNNNITITQEQLDNINKAFGEGNEITIENFSALSKEEQEKLIECYG